MSRLEAQRKAAVDQSERVRAKRATSGRTHIEAEMGDKKVQQERQLLRSDLAAWPSRWPSCTSTTPTGARASCADWRGSRTRSCAPSTTGRWDRRSRRLLIPRGGFVGIFSFRPWRVMPVVWYPPPPAPL